MKLLQELETIIRTPKTVSEAKKSSKKMQVPGVKVKMLQSWQRKLPAAVKKLGYDVEMSGFEDGSTAWAVAFHMPKKFNIKKFEDALRDELQTGGYMEVSEFDMVESE